MELTLESTIICGECEVQPPTWDCKDCCESYCDECKEKVHSKGMRKQHTNMERIWPCSECHKHMSTRKCEDCKGRVYCETCFLKLHNRTDGKYRRHMKFEIFGVKEKPFIDPENSNGFGIDTAQLVVTAKRFSQYQSVVDHVLNEFRETTTTSDPPVFLDVEGVPYENSLTLKRAYVWRRIEKILEELEFEEPTTARSVCSRQSRTSMVGKSIVSLETALNTNWHKERKTHYLFELPNNRLLTSAHSGLRKNFYGVTALAKFLDYEEPQDLNVDGDIQIDIPDLCPGKGRAFDLSVASTIAMNRLAMEHLVVSAEYFRSPGLMFYQFFNVLTNKWECTWVDDVFPCDSVNNLLFGATEQGNETWKSFLWKAYAKFNGGMKFVEESQDVMRGVRSLLGGHCTVDIWSPKMFRDAARSSTGMTRKTSALQAQEFMSGSGAQASPKARLSNFLWWYIQRMAFYESVVIFSNAKNLDCPTEGQYENSAIVEVDDGGQSNNDSVAAENDVHDDTTATATIVDEVELESSKKAKTETKVETDHILDIKEHVANYPSQTEKLLLEPNQAAVGIFGVELTSKKGTAMGLRREFIGNGLRLVQLRQFSGWQMALPLTATSAKSKFRYYHSSQLWTKELREHFSYNCADDDLVYGTLDDIINAYNSVSVCSFALPPEFLSASTKQNVMPAAVTSGNVGVSLVKVSSPQPATRQPNYLVVQRSIVPAVGAKAATANQENKASNNMVVSPGSAGWGGMQIRMQLDEGLIQKYFTQGDGCLPSMVPLFCCEIFDFIKGSAREPNDFVKNMAMHLLVCKRGTDAHAINTLTPHSSFASEIPLSFNARNDLESNPSKAPQDNAAESQLWAHVDVHQLLSSISSMANAGAVGTSGMSLFAKPYEGGMPESNGSSTSLKSPASPASPPASPSSGNLPVGETKSLTEKLTDVDFYIMLKSTYPRDHLKVLVVFDRNIVTEALPHYAPLLDK